MFFMSDNSVTSITATASNCPLTGNESEIKLTLRSLAAINFLGYLTKIIALTNLNLPQLQSMFQLKQFL